LSAIIVSSFAPADCSLIRDPRETLGPLVDGLIALRVDLRATRAWEVADRLRACIADAGVELRDTPEGTVWTLRVPQGRR